MSADHTEPSGVERIAEVLAEHLHIRAIQRCSCGVRGLARPIPDRGEFEAGWAAHVAAALTEAGIGDVREVQAQLDRTEAQIHESGGFIDRVVDGEEETSRLAARLREVEAELAEVRETFDQRVDSVAARWKRRARSAEAANESAEGEIKTLRNVIAKKDALHALPAWQRVERYRLAWVSAKRRAGEVVGDTGYWFERGHATGRREALSHVEELASKSKFIGSWDLSVITAIVRELGGDS